METTVNQFRFLEDCSEILLTRDELEDYRKQRDQSLRELVSDMSKQTGIDFVYVDPDAIQVGDYHILITDFLW